MFKEYDKKKHLWDVTKKANLGTCGTCDFLRRSMTFFSNLMNVFTGGLRVEYLDCYTNLVPKASFPNDQQQEGARALGT